MAGWTNTEIDSMCVICKDWERGKLTSKEALKNIGEVIYKDNKLDKHLMDLSEKILDKEVPLSDNDEEMDKLWQEENK